MEIVIVTFNFKTLNLSLKLNQFKPLQIADRCIFVITACSGYIRQTKVPENNQEFMKW